MTVGVGNSSAASPENLSKLLRKYILNNEQEMPTHLSTYMSVVSQTHKYDTVLSTLDRQRRTAFHYAAIRGHTAVIDAILDSATEEHKANIISLCDNQGNTSIALAAFYGHAETIQSLLNAVNLDARLQMLKAQNKSGLSALHMAASEGQTLVIKTIFDPITVEQNFELLMLLDHHGNTTFGHAAHNGRAETVRYLLGITNFNDKFEMLTLQNKSGFSALQQAACGGHTAVIKIIIDSVAEERQCNILMLPNRNGDTAIALAASNGHIDAIKYILDITPSDSRHNMLKTQNKSGLSALHKAACEGNAGAIKMIIDSVTEEQKYHLLMLQDRNEDIAIAYAASYGHDIAVKCMLDLINPERRYEMLQTSNKSGQSALHKVAWNGHHEVLQKILESVTKEEASRLLLPKSDAATATAISLAAFNGHTETVRQILSSVDSETRYDMLKVQNKAGRSTLHTVAHYGRVDVFEVITSFVSEEQLFKLLKLKDKNEDTALNLAVRKGQMEIVKFILDSVNPPDKRCDMLRWRDSCGQSVLHQAAYDGHTNVLKVFIDSVVFEQGYGLLMLQEDNGNTAIALAASRGHTSTVESILSRIEDPDKMYEMLKVQNVRGRTTLHSAALKGHTNVLMAIMDSSLSDDQKFDLLTVQRDYSGYTVLTLVESGGHTKTVEYMQSTLVQKHINQHEESDPLPKEADGKSAESSLKQERPKDFVEQIASLHSRIHELEVQNFEKAEQLTNANQKYDEQRQYSESKMAEMERQLKAQKKEIEELKRAKTDPHGRISKLQIQNKGDVAPEAAGTAGADKARDSSANTGKESASSDPTKQRTSSEGPNIAGVANAEAQTSSTRTYHKLRSGLVELIEQMSRMYEVHDCRVLQHPFEWENVAVIGTDACARITEPLRKLVADNEELSEFNVTPYDRREEHEKNQLWQLGLKLDRETRTAGFATCELIVQDRDNSHKVYAVGPAHMMFCKEANEKYKTERCDIDKIREEVEESTPPHTVKIKSEKTSQEVHVTEAPLIGYRYKYQQPPPDDQPQKLYTNDCVLFPFGLNEAKVAQKDLKDCNLHRHPEPKLIPVTSTQELQALHDSQTAIAVQNHTGHLYHCVRIQNEINDYKGVDLTFVLPVKDKKQPEPTLSPGDSGSIVYRVVKDKDGKDRYHPWGMLVADTLLPFNIKTYHAVVLEQVFKDIEHDYDSVSNLQLFQVPNHDEAGSVVSNGISSSGPQPTISSSGPQPTKD